MSTKDLRKEANSYCLQATGDRADLIDVIMSHLERNGPLADLSTNLTVAAETRAQPPPLASSEVRLEYSSRTPSLSQIMKTMSACMQQQKLILQQLQLVNNITAPAPDT